MLLTTGELIRESLALVGQPDQLQHERHLFANHVAWLADDLECECNVLEHGLVEQQLVVLEDVAERATQKRHPRRRQFAHVATGHPYVTLGCHFLPAHQAKQRGLARTRRPHEEHEVALGHVERHVVDGEGVVPVDLGDTVELDHY